MTYYYTKFIYKNLNENNQNRESVTHGIVVVHVSDTCIDERGSKSKVSLGSICYCRKWKLMIIYYTTMIR